MTGLISKGGWLALGALLATVLAGGLAYAAIPSSEGAVISGCYEKRTGLLRVIDVEAGKACSSLEVPISWNQKGLKGEQGDQGLQGVPGEKGDKGDQGLPGPAGKDGEDGIDGTNGTNGTNGADGVSVTSQSVASGDANCPAGGSKFTAANGVTYACNGRDGADGTSGGATEAPPTSVYIADQQFGTLFESPRYGKLEAQCFAGSPQIDPKLTNPAPAPGTPAYSLRIVTPTQIVVAGPGTNRAQAGILWDGVVYISRIPFGSQSGATAPAGVLRLEINVLKRASNTSMCEVLVRSSVTE